MINSAGFRVQQSLANYNFPKRKMGVGYMDKF